MLLRIYVPATGHEAVYYLSCKYHDVHLLVVHTEVVLRCRRTHQQLFTYNAAPHYPTAALHVRAESEASNS